jgi:hypothetical protein
MKVLDVFNVPRSRPRWRGWVAAGVVVTLLAPLGWGASPLSAASRVSAASPVSAVSAPPDALIAWDTYAMSVLGFSQGQLADVTSAMTSAAMYDAVNAIYGTPYEPYLVAPAADGTESVDAAVAAAVTDLLVWLAPERRDEILQHYDEALAEVPAGAARDGGVRVGREAAAAMIAARTDDGRDVPATWPPANEPGDWVPTPPSYGSEAAELAHVEPFVLPSLDMFRTSGPPALTSRRYTRDFNEIKAKGVWWGGRTAEENEVAQFWLALGADFEIKRQLATSQGLDAMETARLFALADLAKADGHDACYNEKAAWHFWRPITAIQQATWDGNPDTAPDLFWSPAFSTPPFPDYPSGRACHVAAQMVAHRLFFGRDDVPFHATVGGITRSYTNFQQAIDDVIDARVWQGIHFRFATVAGARMGGQAAEYIFEHSLRER